MDEKQRKIAHYFQNSKLYYLRRVWPERMLIQYKYFLRTENKKILLKVIYLFCPSSYLTADANQAQNYF